MQRRALNIKVPGIVGNDNILVVAKDRGAGPVEGAVNQHLVVSRGIYSPLGFPRLPPYCCGWELRV